MTVDFLNVLTKAHMHSCHVYGHTNSLVLLDFGVLAENQYNRWFHQRPSRIR